MTKPRQLEMCPEFAVAKEKLDKNGIPVEIENVVVYRDQEDVIFPRLIANITEIVKLSCEKVAHDDTSILALFYHPSLHEYKPVLEIRVESEGSKEYVKLVADDAKKNLITLLDQAVELSNPFSCFKYYGAEITCQINLS